MSDIGKKDRSLTTEYNKQTKGASIMQLSNKRIIKEVRVLTPDRLIEKLPLSPMAEQTIKKGRGDFEAIVHGISKKIAIMVGPCSIHDPDEGLEYARRLRQLAEKVQDRILIIMRTYFEKPRTTVGWKGLIVQPDVHTDGKDDMNSGLFIARKFLLDVAEVGLPTVTEFLGPIIPQYIADLITTGTIGARTTEAQTHREMASGLSVSIGFKNGTDGSIKIALDAMVAARSEHSFLGINTEGQLRILHTKGNPDGFLILRGGENLTNYDKNSVEQALSEISKRDLSCPILIDCSHGNSGKDHRNQAEVFNSVLRQIASGQNSIIGSMLESNLNPGKQNVTKGIRLTYGTSITDACIGWEETESLIMAAYGRLDDRFPEMVGGWY